MESPRSRRRRFLGRRQRRAVALADDLASNDRALVDEQSPAFVDDVPLHHPVDLEVAAGGLRGFRDEAVKHRLARALREEVPGHHPGDVAHAIVANEQVASHQAGHRRRPRPDHDDGTLEALIEHATPEDADHGISYRPCSKGPDLLQNFDGSQCEAIGSRAGSARAVGRYGALGRRLRARNHHAPTNTAPAPAIARADGIR